MIAFLIQACVVWSVLGAMILFPDERALLRSPWFYAGLLLAFAGFIGLAISRDIFVEPETQKGIWIVMACSLFFGAYSISVRRFLQNGFRTTPSFGVHFTVLLCCPGQRGLELYL